MTDDDRRIWRLCGQPINKKEARHRGEEGDVHAECHDRERRPPNPAKASPLLDKYDQES
jgi:hypothetical protein